MNDVLVMGSANTDLTVQVDHLPGPNETVGNGQLMISFGGKGANQAVAAKQAGARVCFISRIGQDMYGQRLSQHLLDVGICPEGLIRDPENMSGLALIAVNPQGDNQIVVAPGSNFKLLAEDLEKMGDYFDQAKVFLTQLEIPISTVLKGLEMAKSKKLITIVNPAPGMDLPDKIFPLIDIITPNELEAEALTKIKVDSEHNAGKAAQSLLERGVQTVIITLGSRGCLVSSYEADKHYLPYSIDVLDSVAAGDAFNGVLAAILAQGRELYEAVQWANAAGALCAMKRGAQEALPGREEIEELVKKASTD